MKISLIVPTYNRSKYLKESLVSFFKQTMPKDRYEILVLDNNSTDNTKEVVDEFIKEFAAVDCRYLLVKDQGSHNARNRGFLEARNEIIVFGDDDVVADENWLNNIINTFESDERVGLVGGKAKPIWNKKPQEWIYDYGSKDTHPLFAYLDYGDEERILDEEYLFGCNFAIKKNLAIKSGGCFPDVYPKKLKYLAGLGECALVDGVRDLGFKVVYNPNALVHHHADATRISLDYFVDRYERWAVEDAFSCFRDNSKYKASKFLILRAVTKLINAYKCSIKKMIGSKNYLKDKINPDNYIVIEKKYAKQMIKQVFRVLLSPKLYKHITRKSYLDELK